MTNVKQFRYKIATYFNNTLLLIDQNNLTTKIVNDYIVYDLDNWPKHPLRRFTLKNCLFGATNTEKSVHILVIEQCLMD